MKQEIPSRNWEIPSQSSEKSVSGRMVTAEDTANEMKALSAKLAEPTFPGEHLKTCIARVAAKTGLTWRQAKKYWYGETKTVDTHVYLRFQRAVVDHERHLEAHFEASRASRARIHALIHHSSDHEFYSVRAAETLGPDCRSSGAGVEE